MRFTRSASLAILAALVGAGLATVPASGAEQALTQVGLSSPCQDVVVVGARGSGQTTSMNNGLGPEVWGGAQAYADALGAGYKVGYYPLTYPATDFRALVSTSGPARKQFLDSIDNGVYETLSFLSAREQRCRASGERYVLAGFSQGAMVMHRVLWQLTDPKSVNSSKLNYQLAVNVLPRVDGILAIADGDRVSNQGGNQSGGAGVAGHGVWWSLASLDVKNTAAVKYKPQNQPLPTTGAWKPERFYSVCAEGDSVCDWTAGMTAAGLWAHGDLYQPGHGGAVVAQLAAGDIAATTRKQKPPPVVTPPSVPTTPVRVGQTESASLTGSDLGDDVTLAWVSDPLPGATLIPGMAGPAIIAFPATTPGTFPYTVRVTYPDGTSSDVSGAFVAYPTPNPSLAIRNVTSSYSNTAPYGSMSQVAFDIVKVTDSTTTPTMVSDLYDPASDQYAYASGDTNSNSRLDLGETWHYTGMIPWDTTWDPSTSRVVTLVLWANDTTGAGQFLEQTGPDITLTR